MKQSTKLLSLVLAIIMAFSCVSVIGSAVEFDDPSDITYDSIDDVNVKNHLLFLYIFSYCNIKAIYV